MSAGFVGVFGILVRVVESGVRTGPAQQRHSGGRGSGPGHSSQGVIPVVDTHGAYCGTVGAHAVAEALDDGEHDGADIAEATGLRAVLRWSSVAE